MCIEDWTHRDLLNNLVKKFIWELYCVREEDDKLRRIPRYPFRVLMEESTVKNYLKVVLAVAIIELQEFAVHERPRSPVTEKERKTRLDKLLTVSKVVKKHGEEICKTLFNDKLHETNGIFRHLIYENVVRYNVLSFSYNIE